jgi:hypothetical protein
MFISGDQRMFNPDDQGIKAEGGIPHAESSAIRRQTYPGGNLTT